MPQMSETVSDDGVNSRREVDDTAGKRSFSVRVLPNEANKYSCFQIDDLRVNAKK
jgi:hypothetical protein